jgi:polygalacturonase
MPAVPSTLGWLNNGDGSGSVYVGTIPVLTVDANGLTVEGLATAITGRGPTLTVAASDAHATVKAQADYLCDGTDDDVQIQAAIDALAAAGGKVVLTEGTFTIGTAPVLASNTCLVGQGMGITTIIQVDSGDLAILIDGRGVSDIALGHFALDGNYSNQTSFGHGVALSNSTDILLDHIRFKDIGSTAGHRAVDSNTTPYATRLTVRDCDVVDCSDGIIVEPSLHRTMSAI